MKRYILVFCLIMVGSRTVSGYPNYISFGYQSCAGCHYHPLGGGSLTDYGRTVAATAISDRLLWDDGATEDEIDAKSGFAFQEPTIEWLRPSLSYRGLFLSRNFGESFQKNDFITMDLSGEVVGKFLDRDRLIVVGQGGYSPKPLAQKGQTGISEYRTRAHYVGFRPTKELGIYAGLMDKAFGIRVPDHIAFSRMLTQNTQYDQTHGLLLHYSNKMFEASVQPFLGNLVQDKDLRQKGVSGLFEALAGETARIGVSALQSNSDYRSILAYAAHARLGIGKGNSVLAEIGKADSAISAGDKHTVTNYGFVQGHWMIRRGLLPLLTLERQQKKGNIGYTYRVGPGLQFFPLQRIELRTDAYRTIRVLEDTSVKSSTDITCQLHLWL